MLAVQGPKARATLRGIADGELPKRMRTATLPMAGVATLVCGTGYTGEDGCELMIPPDGAATVWDALLEQGVRPAGLGARDTLRLEVCFHLYGNDLSEDRNPIEAGLAWACKLDTDFIGADALRGAEPDQTLVPFAFTGPGIPRQDNPVKAPHGDGIVTSGSLSPCLEIGIGMAYVPARDAKPGTEIEVDVRGKPRAAEVRDKPLFKRREESSG
jgi:aminomethyltransferase